MKENISHPTSRLEACTGLALRLFIKETRVQGEENLENLPKDRPIIFATTHLTTLDVTGAINLIAKNFDINVVHAENQDHFLQAPIPFLTTRIADKNNFLPISPNYIEDEFTAIENTLRSGKPILMAAYAQHGSKNEYYRELTQKNVVLPKKGGIGAVFLAQKTNSIIVPLAVDIADDKVLTINIGEYLDLEKIENLDKFRVDRDETRLISEKLRQQSEVLMDSLRVMMPPDKLE